MAKTPQKPPAAPKPPRAPAAQVIPGDPNDAAAVPPLNSDGITVPPSEPVLPASEPKAPEAAARADGLIDVFVITPLHLGAEIASQGAAVQLTQKQVDELLPIGAIELAATATAD